MLCNLTSRLGDHQFLFNFCTFPFCLWMVCVVDKQNVSFYAANWESYWRTKNFAPLSDFKLVNPLFKLLLLFFLNFSFVNHQCLVYAAELQNFDIFLLQHKESYSRKTSPPPNFHNLSPSVDRRLHVLPHG